MTHPSSFPPRQSIDRMSEVTVNQGKAESATFGRTWVQEEKKVIALTLHVLNTLPRSLAYMSSPKVFKVLGGAGYVIGWTINKMCSGIGGLLDAAEKIKLTENVLGATQVAVSTKLTLADAKREAQGELAQTAISGVKYGSRVITAFLPGFVSQVVEGSADAASFVEEKEREVEKANTWVSGLHAAAGLKVMNIAAALLTKTVKGVAYTGKEGGEYLKNISYKNWTTPDGWQQFYTRVADRVDAYAYTLTNEPGWIEIEPESFEEMDIQFLLERGVEDITPEEHAQFIKTSARFKTEIRLLITHYKDALALTDEKIKGLDYKSQLVLAKFLKQFLPPLFMPQEVVTFPVTAGVEAAKVKDEDIEYYNALSDEAQELLKAALIASKKLELSSDEVDSLLPEEVIGLFKALSVIEKQTLLPPLGLQLSSAPVSLTKEEFASFDNVSKLEFLHLVKKYASLSKEQHDQLLAIHKANDFDMLPETKARALDDLLVQKFATLSSKTKQKLYQFSYDRYNTLSDKAKSALVQVIQERLELEEKPAKELTRKEVEKLLKAFNKEFSKEEIDSLYKTLATDEIAFLEVANVDVEQLILELTKKLVTLDPKGDEAKELERLLDQLRPIDMAHIEELVGAHVITREEAKALSAVGEYVHLGFSAFGRKSEWILGKIGGLFPAWAVSGGIRGTASALELGLAVPAVQRTLFEYIPGAQSTERFLQQLPSLVLSATHAAEEYILTSLQAAIPNLQKQVEALVELPKFQARTELPPASLARVDDAVKVEHASFTTLYTAICEQKEHLMCSDAVYPYLADQTSWQKLAAEYGVAEKSPAFIELLVKMARTGEKPELGSLQESGVVTAMSKKAFEIMQGIKGQASEIVGEQASSIASHIYDAASTWSGAIFGAAAEKLKQTVTGAAAAATTVATAVGEKVAEARGVEQAIPAELQGHVNALMETTKAYQAAQVENELYLQAIETVKKLEESWVGSYAVKPLVDQGVITQNGIAGVSELLKNLHGLLSLSRASQGFLQWQLQGGGDPVEAMLKKTPQQEVSDMTMQLLAQKDFLEMDRDSLAKNARLVGQGLLSGGATVGQFATLMSGNALLLPMFLRATVPPLMRAYADSAAQSVQPFFNRLAKASVQVSEYAGDVAQKAVIGVGRKALGFVSKARLENFTSKLQPHEQKHLVDIALQSGKASDDERKALTKWKSELPHVSLDDLPKLAAMTLAVHDRLDAKEKLAVSPTAFKNFPRDKKEKIIDIVDRHVGLAPREFQDPAAIIEKFNKLPEAQKAELDEMTLLDFRKLPEGEQKNLLFMLAFSSKSKEGEPESYYDRLQNYRTYATLSNKELQKLMPFLQELKEEGTDATLAPYELKKMGDLQVARALVIVRTYHPELIDQLYVDSKGKYDLAKLSEYLGRADLPSPLENKKNELIEALCAIFDELAITEQEEITLVTQKEWESLAPIGKERLIRFLIAQEGYEGFTKLHDLYTAFSADEPYDARFVVQLFNQLSPTERALFRYNERLTTTAEDNLKKSVQLEVVKTDAALQVLNVKLLELRSLSKNYTIRIDDAKKEKDIGKQKELELLFEKNIQKIQKLQRRRHELERKLEALVTFVDIGLSATEKQALLGRSMPVGAVQKALSIKKEWIAKEAFALTFQGYQKRFDELSKRTGQVGARGDLEKSIREYDEAIQNTKSQIDKKLENHQRFSAELQAKMKPLRKQIDACSLIVESIEKQLELKSSYSPLRYQERVQHKLSEPELIKKAKELLTPPEKADTLEELKVLLEQKASKLEQEYIVQEIQRELELSFYIPVYTAMKSEYENQIAKYEAGKKKCQDVLGSKSRRESSQVSSAESSQESTVEESSDS